MLGFLIISASLLLLLVFGWICWDLFKHKDYFGFGVVVPFFLLSLILFIINLIGVITHGIS